MTQESGTSRVVLQESPKRHNPLTFYLRTLFYMLMAFALRALCCAPLCALLLFPAGSAWRWLALLCPVLIVLFILPMRFSFAQALVQRRRERYFSFDTAFSTSQYGEKLAESLLHAINVIKWGVPFLAMLAGMAIYVTRTELMDLVYEVTDFGAWVTKAWCDFVNFFAHLFNGAYNLSIQGGLMEGVYGLLGVLGILALIWLIGASRNSATRYIWVVADRADQNPRTEIRRRLRGRRFRQFCVSLLNLLLWTPALAGLYVAVSKLVGSLSGLSILYLKNSLASIDLLSAVCPLLLVFFGLYLPLLPIRRYLTASFASRAPRHAVPNRVASGGAKQSPAKLAQPDQNAEARAVPAWQPEKPAETPLSDALPVPEPTLSAGQPYDPQALNAQYASRTDPAERTVTFPLYDVPANSNLPS